jgi:hypothetical protein
MGTCLVYGLVAWGRRAGERLHPVGQGIVGLEFKPAVVLRGGLDEQLWWLWPCGFGQGRKGAPPSVSSGHRGSRIRVRC